MKKVLYLLASALFLLGAASCEKKTVNSDCQSEEQAGKVKVTFDASSQQSGTKTTLSATDQVLWSAGDAVYICTDDEEEEEFTISSGVGTTSGIFTGWASTEFTAPYYAIYPATAALGMELDNILFSLPSDQTYAVNSFGNGNAIMAAYSAKEKSLAFKNLVGLIDLKLTGEGTLKSLTLTSAANYICGTFGISKTDPTATLEPTKDSDYSITLNGVNAITLSSTATHVYIAVAPTAFAANDLTLSITNSADKSFSTTIGGFTATRAGIKEVPVAVEFGGGSSDTCDGITKISSTSVTDLCGNTYQTVQIGTQIWMAENFKCNQYSSNLPSDQYDETEIIGQTITAYTTQSSRTPLYIDVTASGYGYYYNWSAAVGIPNSNDYSTPFTAVRQGICPDGWHVPTNDEFATLRDYIEVTKGKGTDKAGKYLKSETGWNDAGNGLDCFGFNGIPVGQGTGTSHVGDRLRMYTATIVGYVRLEYDTDEMEIKDSAKGNEMYSVRCLKN